jgi:arylsulfatase A-like enzyme
MKKKIKTKIFRIFYNLFVENVTKNKKNLDERFSKDVIDFIPKLKEPYFLWLHFMDVHHPYIPQKQFRRFGKADSISHFSLLYLNYLARFNKKSSKNQIQKLIDLYDSLILQADHQIGIILDQLKKRNNFDDSLIIITSDHGEAFKEHGTFLHPAYYPFNELLQVPLIIKYPNQTKGRIVKNDVSLINIPPTITNIMGIDNPSIQRGTELPKRTKSKNETIHSEGYPMLLEDSVSTKNKKIPVTSIVKVNDWKLIINYEYNQHYLFNLSSDPLEKTNLIKKEKDKLLELSTILDSHILQEKKTKQFEKSLRNKIKFKFEKKLF